MPCSSMIRVLIADGHRLMREGLDKILKLAPDIAVTGHACDRATTLSVAVHMQPDVLLLDLSMPGFDGIELIGLVRSKAPKVNILVLTTHEEGQYAVRSIRAGALGFLRKETTCSRILTDSVRLVANGRPVISPQVAKLLAQQPATAKESASCLAGLSCRERQVFRMLVDGATVSGISEALGLSVKTVSTFKARMERKLGVSGIGALVLFAIDHKVLDDQAGKLLGTLVTQPVARAKPGSKNSAHHLATTPERRQCRLTESKVNVAIILLDMLGRDDAARYLAAARVPNAVAVRVVGYPDRCRKPPLAS